MSLLFLLALAQEVAPYKTSYRVIDIHHWQERISGVKLPPDILEKLYDANAERLVPAFKPK